jgi:hypothetical protein
MTIFGTDERTPSNNKSVFKGTSDNGNFSGALVSDDLVLSAAHVKKGGEKIYFETTEGVIEGKPVYSDIRDDIMLFQLVKQVKTITPLEIYSPTKDLLSKGTTLIGFHADIKGQSSSTEYNTQIVSDDGKELLYKHDAYRGSSGGPLLDYLGRLIGINYLETYWANYGTAIDSKLIEKIRYYDSLVGGKSKIKLENTPLLEDDDITRIYDSETHTHFYTSDTSLLKELTNDSRFVVEDKWVDNGENDVYELYNSKSGDYLYTSDQNEIEKVSENLPDYKLNGAVFGVEDDTIHRLYNPTSGQHFYTDSKEEHDNVIANLGFVDEGYL